MRLKRMVSLCSKGFLSPVVLVIIVISNGDRLPRPQKFHAKQRRAADAGALGIAVGDDVTEASLILCRGDKGAHHAQIVIKLPVIQNVQPEIIASWVSVTPQIAEVLHKYKSGIVLRLFD